MVPCIRSRYEIVYTCILGDPSRQDLQVAYRLRLSHITLAINNEKDLDNTAALGGFHSLCGDCRSREFPGSITTPERTTAGTSGEAATHAGTVARLCSEKGWQSCARRRLLGDHRRGRAAGRRINRTWDTSAEYAVGHTRHGRADAIIVLLV